MDEKVIEVKTQWYGTEECFEMGDVNLFHQNIIIQDNLSDSRKQQVLISSPEFTCFNDFCYNIGTSPAQLCQEELANLATIHSEFPELLAKRESSCQIPINTERKFRQSDYDQFNLPNYDTTCINASKKLSTKDFLRLGGETFIQSSLAIVDSISSGHPFSTSLCGLSDEEHRDVEIIQHLLASAEKVGGKQFSRASNLLHHCHEYSSITGTPVQRLVYYFSAALQQKIYHETGRRTSTDTGKMQSLALKDMLMNPNLSSSFDVVMVADMLDLNESLFRLNAEEKLAVYSPYILSFMIEKPAQLETLMKVIQKINPCIMIVTEVEANHNSPVFVHRFIEALFYYSAFFDSMEECMDRDDPDRLMSESIQLCPAITNIVVYEGEERIIRHVNSNVWKAFFSRFGLVETELSTASLHQAKLLVDNFVCANSCTIEMAGKSLAIGWKGTPILSVSALKFL